MPSKPWLRAWACVDAKLTIFLVCSLLWRYVLTYLRSVPHCVPNKACAKTGTHTLLITSALPSRIMDICLVFPRLAMYILANHVHV